MERPQQPWTTTPTATSTVAPALAHGGGERGRAALRELRSYPFFAGGGDSFDRLNDFGGTGEQGAHDAEVAARLALSVALCQSHARVRAIEKLLAEAMEALYDPEGGATIPPALPALLRETGQQLAALGSYVRATE